MSTTVLRADPYLEVRSEEDCRENCERVAIDAIYEARNGDRNLHDAGREAADAVITVIAHYYPSVREMPEKEKSGV